MTNNQRFAAELIVLLTLGAVLWSKASPVRQDPRAVPEVLAVHSLLIVDGNGTPRARLTADENAPGLILLDKDGKTVRGRFVVYPDTDHRAQVEASGPTLDITDKGGEPVAVLSTRSLAEKETTFLHLHRGDNPPMHTVPVHAKREDIDIFAGDNGHAGVYMISVQKNQSASWAQLTAEENGQSEAIASRFTHTIALDRKDKTHKGKK